jgi:hypothetical protein
MKNDPGQLGEDSMVNALREEKNMEDDLGGTLAGTNRVVR